MAIDEKELDNRFTYHAPKGNQQSRYENIRKQGRDFVNAIVLQSPESREQSLALTKIEEAVMWANAAIARRE